jgi:exopolysaccharide production protein ExoQ
MFKRILLFLELCAVILLFIFAIGFVLPLPIQIIFNATSYGILLLLVIGRWRNFIYVACQDKTLLFLIALTAISILWSENVIYTAEYSRGLIRSTLFGAYLSMRYTFRDQMRLWFWVFSLTAVLSLVASILLPAYGTHVINGVSSWRGVFEHKQDLGRIMGFAASMFLVTMLDKRSKRWATLGGLICALLLVTLSNSITGLIVFLFSLCLVPFYKIIKQRRNRVFQLIMVLLLCTIVSLIVTVNLETIVVKGFKKNLEFNGRTPIWTLAIEKGLERPVLGYGYHGFWSSDAGSYVVSRTWLGTPNENWENNVYSSPQKVLGISHNGFIDWFLQLGFLGLIMFILNLSMVLSRVFILLLATRKMEYFWMFVFIGLKLVANISDSSTIAEPNNIFWISYVTVALSSSLELSRLRKQQQQFECSSNLPVLA